MPAAGAHGGQTARLVGAYLVAAFGIGLVSLWVLRVTLAYDSSVAIAFTTFLVREVELGAIWPRWLFDANAGFGSPAFIFYPPLSYVPPVALSLATGANVVLSLTLASMLWRVLAFATAFLWMRRLVGRQAALIGAGLYILMPYIAFANPFIRFAYAEMAAAAIVPLVFLAAHRERPAEIVFWTGVAFLLLVLTHLPTALLMTICGPAYAFLRGEGRVVRTASVSAGAVVGVLAGCAYLVPALALQGFVSPDQWDDPPGKVTFNLLPQSGPLRDPGFLWDRRFPLYAGLHLSLLVAAPLMLLSYPRRASERAAALPVFLTGLLVLALMTRVSLPFWLYMPVFPRVQFPWRLMTVASLLAGASVALLAQRLLSAEPPARGWLWAILGAVSALTLAGFPVLPPEVPINERVRLLMSDRERIALALSRPYADPPEYWPPASLGLWRRRLGDPAATHEGWTALRRIDHAAAAAEGRFPAGVPVLLGQFWFPGLTATAGGAPASAEPDPGTGLILVRPAVEAREIVIRRGTTEAERLGMAVSGLGVLLLVGAWALARRSGRPAAPGAA
jgi:hypothetical protein